VLKAAFNHVPTGRKVIDHGATVVMVLIQNRALKGHHDHGYHAQSSYFSHEMLPVAPLGQREPYEPKPRFHRGLSHDIPLGLRGLIIGRQIAMGMKNDPFKSPGGVLEGALLHLGRHQVQGIGTRRCQMLF